MVESNFDALGKGLKVYTDAMRHFVQERLIARYPNTWWEDGVMKQLTDQQRSNIKKNIERNPDKPKLDHIDAPHFVRIITRQFDHAFAGVFPDFKKTQSWLLQAGSARDDWAHPRTGDMLTDEVGNYLYTMAQVLAAAKLPQAADVDALRKDVLGLTDGAAARAARGKADIVKPAGEGELPYWWQVCEPHDAFKNPATIDESLFAATLGGVHAGSARDEYLKPAIFFAHTYFTENLKQTIRDVASRMAGGDGPSVTEMQTPFGGGKTHALLALYHLIKSPAESLAVPGVREALGDVQIPANANVLVFDGQEYGSEPWTKENGATVSTMWGELAFQIGGQDVPPAPRRQRFRWRRTGQQDLPRGPSGGIAVPHPDRRAGELPRQAEVLQREAHTESVSANRAVPARDATGGGQHQRHLHSHVAPEEPR